MAKVIMTCGKICSGKSTYAQQIKSRQKAVILSVDEITLALFGQSLGDKLDGYVEKTEEYLFRKSVEIVKTGINVILDWGFWTKKERMYAREFYSSNNIEYEFHYIDINDELWKMRITQRNNAVNSGECEAYFIDDNLVGKFKSFFEVPEKNEIDLWIKI